jgi:hypothetical protein
MGRTACTEPQCLQKGDFYLYLLPAGQSFPYTLWRHREEAEVWLHLSPVSALDGGEWRLKLLTSQASRDSIVGKQWIGEGTESKVLYRHLPNGTKKMRTTQEIYEKSNIEVPSRNHCWRGVAIIIKYYDFVSVFLGACGWLRHCATNQKVAGSIPYDVTGIFHRHNPPGRTMALG